MIFNYGALPQTWENPNHITPVTAAKGAPSCLMVATCLVMMQATMIPSTLLVSIQFCLNRCCVQCPVYLCVVCMKTEIGEIQLAVGSVIRVKILGSHHLVCVSWLSWSV